MESQQDRPLDPDEYESERELVRASSWDCLECGNEFSGWQYSKYTAYEKGVCVDCFHDVLSGEDRMEIAKRSKRLREQRLQD